VGRTHRWSDPERDRVREAYHNTSPKETAEQFWRSVSRKAKVTQPWRKVMWCGRSLLHLPTKLADLRVSPNHLQEEGR